MKSYHQGKFKPRNPEKYKGNANNIVFRSGWERRIMVELDRNPNVLVWASEETVIPYYSKIDRKQRRYFTDFTVKLKLKDGSIKYEIWECKPFKETLPPTKRGKKKERYLQEVYTYQVNQDKWEAAREFCRKRNIHFRIVTEKELGIK